MIGDAAKTEDAILLRRYVKSGAEDAFTELVTRHLALVFSSALRQVQGDRHVAEDISQAVFTELAHQAARLTSHPTLAGWLYTTTRRITAHALRGDRRRRNRDQEAFAMRESEDGPGLHSPDWDRLRPVLDAAMHELSETDRIALLLRHFEEKSLAEVGSELGLSENAARMRVGRALEKLRDGLRARGISSSTEALERSLDGRLIEVPPAGMVSLITATALAATTTTTSALALTTTMASLKMKLCAAFILTAAAAVPFLQQHRANTRLQASNLELSRQLEEANENLKVAGEMSDRASEELGRLRAREVDAVLLKAQLERLRIRGGGSERNLARSLPAVTNAPPPHPPTPVVLGTELQDMGAATPERALTSLMWAVERGRIDRMPELLQLPVSVPENDAPRHFEFFANQLSNVFNSMEFTGMKSVRPNEDGTLRLTMNYTERKSGVASIMSFMLQQQDSGWKVRVEGEVPASFH